MTESVSRDVLLSSPVPDIPRLRKVLEHVTAHPEEWYQASYAVDISDRRRAYLANLSGETAIDVGSRGDFCGTALCFAGQTVVDAGYTPVWTPHRITTSLCLAPGLVDTNYTELISDVAQTLLGLTDKEQDELFDGHNTLEDLWRIAREIAARAGEEL